MAGDKGLDLGAFAACFAQPNGDRRKGLACGGNAAGQSQVLRQSRRFETGMFRRAPRIPVAKNSLALPAPAFIKQNMN
jgi:hypothetical protein